MKRGVWLGFFFFSAIVALGFGTLLVGRITFFKKTTEIRIHFTDVLGLKEGADVRVEGVLVGKVTELRLSEKGGVDVVARMDSPVVLYEGYEVFVEAFTVLGGNYVSIHRGPIGNPVDLANLVGQTRENALNEVGALAAENREAFRELIVNLRDITKSLKETKGTIPKLLNEPTLHDEAVELIKEAKKAVELLKEMATTYDAALKKGEGPIGRLLNDKAMADKIDSAITSMEKTAKSLESISKKIDSGEGFLGTIINDPEMGEKFKKTLDNIQKTSESLKNISGGLERGDGTIGKLLQDDELYEKAKKTLEDLDKTFGKAARAKVWVYTEAAMYTDTDISIAKMAIRIEPDEDKYFHVGAAFLSLDKNGDTIVFEDQIEQDDDQVLIKPEIMLAYRIPWFLDKRLTVKAGLLEGKPGGGVEFLWEDWGLFKHEFLFAFEIRDAYNDLEDEDLDENVSGPMMRLRLKTAIWRKDGTEWWEKLLHAIKVHGGVSRIQDDPEFFIGIGLEWQDEDIRTLVSLLGLSR